LGARVNWLDEELGRFARRELDCKYAYLILDAPYEKLRERRPIPA
jgi:transposase-like protein